MKSMLFMILFSGTVRRIYFKNHEAQLTTWEDPRAGQQEAAVRGSGRERTSSFGRRILGDGGNTYSLLKG